MVTTGGQRLLAIADFHAGYEAGLRAERGVHVESRATERRDRLLELVADTTPDRLLVVGDLTHAVGDARGTERREVEALFAELAIPVTVAKGNHDGGIEDWIDGAGAPDVTVFDASGGRLGGVGAVHGHAWPGEAALDGEVLLVGHEHPHVRLDDAVGGARVEPVWIRGEVDSGGFPALPDTTNDASVLVVLPAFNRRLPGAGLAGDSFLAPFLPAGIRAPTAYLLDGTDIGWPNDNGHLDPGKR